MQPDQGQLLLYPLAPFRLGHARQFKAKAYIVAHAAPRQQAELLEHHRHTFAPHPAQIVGRGAADGAFPALVINPHLAPDHRVQPVHGAQQRRFARTRKPHQHQNLTLLDLERAVVDAQYLVGGDADLTAFLTRIHQGQGGPGVVSEHDRNIVKRDSDVMGAHLLFLRSIRSSMIATATMTKPDSKPRPGSLRPSAWTTGLPRPSAPT